MLEILPGILASHTIIPAYSDLNTSMLATVLLPFNKPRKSRTMRKASSLAIWRHHYGMNNYQIVIQN